jgi:polysaccharide export outer membrane protein
MLSVLCAGRASAQPPVDYVIGPQDVLAITVWDQSDLAGKFAVETDGTFTFPLIGRVKAGGLTLRELEDRPHPPPQGRLFINPQVTVAIEQYRSQRVFVVGEVRTPGPQSLTGDMTLVEALSRAGSTLPSAGDEAVIVRPPASGARTPLVLPPASSPLMSSGTSAGGSGRRSGGREDRQQSRPVGRQTVATRAAVPAR